MYIRRKRRCRSIPVLPIFVFIIIVVIIGFIIGNNAFKKKKIINEPATTVTTVSKTSTTTKYAETQTKDTTTTTKTTTSKTSAKTTAAIPTTPTGDWKLILVNSKNILPDSFTVKLADITSVYQADARIIDVTKSMLKNAKNDGISLIICSAYRSVSSQTRLYNNKVAYYKSQGESDADARAVAGTIVAVPKTSEHHTGLALDIVTKSYQGLDSGFEKTAAFKWLSNNAYKYGFILRYPKDKKDITKITYEPWHYRYVGITAAKEIHDRKICLEEYFN